MKTISKLFALSVMCLSVAFACTDKVDQPADDNNKEQQDPGNNDNKKDEKPAPELKEESLAALPTGDTLTFAIEAEGAWTIAADDCDWITVDPESGNGNTDVTFYVSANNAGKDRSVSFYVEEGEYETYEIFISQVKMELPIHEGDMEFLKYLVDNKCYGDATPNITDWYSFNGEGFPYINFGVDAAGKMFIQTISFRASDDTPSSTLFNSFPPTVNLQNCEEIYINCTHDGTDAATMADWMVCALKGSEFPTEWNCPKLWRLHLECVGMQGVLSESLAALPALQQLFIRCCDVYGALPHDWASKELTNLVIGYGGAAADCPNMGYLVPASFDIILNSERTTVNAERMRDKGGLHLAGAPENWQGYEAGWGQKRYEKFDPAAVVGDTMTWSDYRGLTEGTAEEVAAGGLRNPLDLGDWYLDSWQWFFWRMGNQPKTLIEWNQADADAFTAAAAAKPRIFTR